MACVNWREVRFVNVNFVPGVRKRIKFKIRKGSYLMEHIQKSRGRDWFSACEMGNTVEEQVRHDNAANL